MGITLAPKAVTVIELKQVRRYDAIRARADLAVAARETRIEGAAIHVVLHNLGSADAPAVAVAVVDDGGTVVARTEVGSLSAPIDLVPKRLPFSLRLPRVSSPKWSLVVDPDGRVPEIHEGNNRVALDTVAESNRE